MKNLTRGFIFICLLVILYTCKKEKDPNPATDYVIYSNGVGIIGAGGGKITVSDQNSVLKGAGVDIPAGALKSPVTFSINKVDKGYSFENDSTIIFVSLEPSGTKFEKPVTIGIPYSVDANPDSLQVYYYDELVKTWKTVLKSSIDRINKLIIAETNHFTVFTAAKSSVQFEIDLFKKENALSARVWLSTPFSSFTLYGNDRLYGNTINEVIWEANWVLAVGYVVQLKEKVYFWYDKVLATKKILYYDNLAIDESNVKIWSDGSTFGALPKDEIIYYSGRPVLIQFPGVTFDNSKKYYLDITMYFLNDYHWTDPLEFFGETKGYFVSSYEDAKTPLEMKNPPDDANWNGIIDVFDSFYKIPPSLPSSPSPSNGATDISTSPLLSWSTSASPNGDPITYDVYFGTSSSSLPLVFSAKIGTTQQQNGLANSTNYFWKVIAKDNHGNIATGGPWSFKTVSAVSAPVANFIAIPTTISAGGSVQFTDQSTNSPTSWLWNFGDGATSASQNPSHTYNAVGIYNVSLTATNGTGPNTKTLSNYITVNAVTGSAPVANFIAIPTTISAGGSVQFTDQSTNSPTSWLWNFGDGATSASQNPSHTYSTVGVYNVSLTATNGTGPNTKTVSNYITVNAVSTSAPIANFTAIPTTLTVGGSVQFTDQSTNIPTSWLWNFGDGATSTSQNPSHTYSTVGVYNVSLTATNGTGPNTKTVSNYITVIPQGGNGIIFNPNLNYDSVNDNDGNTYKTIQIGTQVWMAENLKATKYNDGTAIPHITVNATWAAATTGAYSDYSNTPANSATYGRLYNWYAVDNNAATKVASNGGKNVCPTSWHVPTDAEWTTLTTNLGEESVAGGKLKETGTTHWTSPNPGATNETGFTALPGGNRYNDGAYGHIGGNGCWWSSTGDSTADAWVRYMGFLSSNVYRSNLNKLNGYSVRCVRDF